MPKWLCSAEENDIGKGQQKVNKLLQKNPIKNRRAKHRGINEVEKWGKVMTIKPIRKVKIKKEILTQVWAGAGDGGDEGRLTRERS